MRRRRNTPKGKTSPPTPPAGAGPLLPLCRNLASRETLARQTPHSSPYFRPTCRPASGSPFATLGNHSAKLQLDVLSHRSRHSSLRRRRSTNFWNAGRAQEIGEGGLSKISITLMITEEALSQESRTSQQISRARAVRKARVSPKRADFAKSAASTAPCVDEGGGVLHRRRTRRRREVDPTGAAIALKGALIG